MRKINLKIEFERGLQILTGIEVQDDATEIEVEEQIHEEVVAWVRGGEVIYHVIKEESNEND
jgi:hypothetical protein